MSILYHYADMGGVRQRGMVGKGALEKGKDQNRECYGAAHGHPYIGHLFMGVPPTLIPAT